MRSPYATWILISLAVACASALWAQGETGGTTPATDWPVWLERWLFNADERTRSALASVEAGDAEGAVEPLETALRLEREHPAAQYNAGAARLGAGRSDAQSLLAAAAESDSETLATLARYNLGNARLADREFQGAIEAYQQALRLDPALEDAKFNLELARRRLEEQQEQQQDPPPQDQPQQEPQQQDPKPQDSQPQDQPQPEPQDQPPEPPQEPQQEPEPEPDQDPQQQESPLPQFRDLPDMTAEEAAAILEAIENMEREQRRQDAIEAARQSHRVKKDW